MAWLKVDDKRAMHRKFRRQGFAVRGLDEAAMCYCAHEETDGRITEVALDDLAHHHGVGIVTAKKLAGTLVTIGRWEVVPTGWMVLGYLDFNPSHADLESKRKRDRERKRLAGESSGNPSGSDAES